MKSFDIFDTLITRKTAVPEGIFILMQKSLSEEKFSAVYEVIQDNWFSLREDAQTRASSLLQGKHPTLDGIYDCLQEITGLSAEQCNRLKNLELELEYENIVPVKKNIDTLKKYVSENEKVVLISDMYLSSEQIRKLLVKADDIFENIPIYVSCEYRCNKASGELYEVVKKAENRLSWEHFGDDLTTDVIGAGKAGVVGTNLDYEGLTEGEKRLLSLYANNSAIQLLTGITRNYRLNCCNTVSEKAGATFGASILLPYVYWVLESCKKKGIRKLFFVARDGYILKKLAQQVIEKENYDIDTFYLYGSRVAWNNLDANEISLSVRDLEKNRKAKEYILQELASCGHEEAIGMVDVNGSGNTQNKLSVYIQDEIGCKVHNYFYHMHYSGGKMNVPCYRFCERKYDAKAVILEQLTKALHGKTVDYEMKNGKYVPVFCENAEGEALREYGYDTYITAACEVCMQLVSHLSPDEMNCYGKDMSLFMLDYLIHEEKDDYFEYLCELPFCNTRNKDENFQQFATKFTQKDIKNIYLYHRLENYIKNDVMVGAYFSLRRCSQKEKKWIEKYKKCRENSFYVQLLGNMYPTSVILDEKELKKKIVVYGAGRIGKELVRRIDAADDKEVVLWTDSHYDMSKSDKRIRAAEDIKNVKYDWVVIAVANYRSMESIRNTLLDYGVKNRKIKWIPWNIYNLKNKNLFGI